MNPEIVVEEERLEYVLESFGYDIDEEKFIVDAESRDRVVSTSGKPIRKDDLGMLGHGSVDLVEDDISELSSYLQNRSE